MRMLLILMVIVTVASRGIAAERLPQGAAGLAAKYPGDREIAKDASVVFAELFDAPSVDEVAKRWETVAKKDWMSLAGDQPAGNADGKSLLVKHVGGGGEEAFLYRRLAPGHDKLHYRFYTKFAKDCAPLSHFVQVGGFFPATPWPKGGAGTRPKGSERFSAAVEPFGKMWQWDYYCYWHEMGASPPRGNTWGNSFLHDPQLKVKREEWICVELMLKLNQLGQRDGEMALWIDGKLLSHLGPGFPKGKWTYDKFLPGEGGGGVRWSDAKKKPEYFEVPAGGEPFEGFSWRTEEKLNLNFLWMLCFLPNSPRDHESRIWFDNIVVAKEYVGPIAAPRSGQ